MSLVEQQPTRVIGPAGFDPEPFRAMLAEPGFVEFRRADTAWRVEQCRRNPLLFALVYLRPTLRKGVPDITFSEFHIAAYRAAVRWCDDQPMYALRDAWLASRNAGKSSVFFLILAIWAMAYGHRRFIIALSDVSSIAEGHLATLRDELKTNARLRRDFPKLCTPVRSTNQEYVAATGAAIVVRGLDSGMLGMKIGNDRPDLILIDDGEGTKGRYSMAKKATRLDTLLTAVLPLDLRAAVQLVGTTTRYGSILHDIQQGEPWAVSEHFRLRHYPALITDPTTGRQRSGWPGKWPLEFLLAEQGKHGFDLNFQCEPSAPGGSFWTPDDIDIEPELARSVRHLVLAIDPAVTSKATSDQTGMALLGYAPEFRRVIVLRAAGFRVNPEQLSTKVHAMIAAHPDIKEVVVERNQGHDFVSHAIGPLPTGVRLVPKVTTHGKAERFGILLRRYQPRTLTVAGGSRLHHLPPEVVHAGPFPALERQMLTVTGGDEPDDIIDSVSIGVEHIFS